MAVNGGPFGFLLFIAGFIAIVLASFYAFIRILQVIVNEDIEQIRKHCRSKDSAELE